MSPLEAQFRRDFADVAAVVDRSDVAVDFEHLTVKRSKSGKVMGRPRRMTMRAYIILAVLTCLRERPPTHVKVTKTANELPDDLLEELGLKSPDEPRQTIKVSQIGHMFNLIANKLDLSPHRPGKRLRMPLNGKPINEHKAIAIDRKCLQPDLTADELIPEGPTRELVPRAPYKLPAEELAERQRVLHLLVDRLIQATIPASLDIKTVAVDWTDREAWARTYRKAQKNRDGITSADPDARWGFRRSSGNSIPGGRPAPRRGKEPLDDSGFETDKTERFFGYIPHIAVAAPEIEGPSVPEVALALRVDPANNMGGVGDALVDMIDSAGRIANIQHAIIDRGYSMRSPNSVHLPLADRDVHLTFDLAKPQRERSGSVQGAVMMAGDFYCPLVPRDIEVDGIPGPQATRDDWAKFHKRHEQRKAWRFYRKGATPSDLKKQRLLCPAVAGQVRCPLRPDSMELPTDLDIPEIYESQVEHLRTARPHCCTSKSITVGREDGVGLRQKYPFGSKKWIRSYDRRTASERYISHYKKLVRTARKDVQMFGRTRQTLAIGFATAALNIHLLRNWEPDER